MPTCHRYVGIFYLLNTKKADLSVFEDWHIFGQLKKRK